MANSDDGQGGSTIADRWLAEDEQRRADAEQDAPAREAADREARLAKFREDLGLPPKRSRSSIAT